MTTKNEARQLLRSYKDLAARAENSDSEYLIKLIREAADELSRQVGSRRATTIEFVLN